jgi:predicted PurR-regulated permease PerM
MNSIEAGPTGGHAAVEDAPDTATLRANAGPPPAGKQLPAPAINGSDLLTARRWPLWLGLAVLLYLLRSVVGPFVFAAIAAYVLGWPIRSLAGRTRLPVPLLVAVLYALVIGSLVLIGVYFGPVLAQETADLATSAPNIIESLFRQATGREEISLLGLTFSGADIADSLQSQVLDAVGHPSDALVAAQALLSGLIETLVFLVALFYLLVDGPRISEYVLSRFVALPHQATIRRVDGHLRTALERYIRGQAFLVVLMSVVSYLVLSLLFGLPYALTIAIATGFMEIVPILGPVIATFIAASVGLFQGGAGTAAGIIVAYVVLRQIEDQLVMPVIIGRAVHLHPLATILAVVSGSALAGIPGMIIAVPVAAAGKILLDELAPPPAEAASVAAQQA